ncbi:MAG: S1 RNA-binding domain-containing protein, partial [Planctomycetes bacterium]|nr:S1 RNA-binding domain-containing protein [Planctomycetota bacterium]
MVNFALLKDLGLDEPNAGKEVRDTFKDLDENQVGELLQSRGKDFTNGAMLKGKVVNIRGDDVVLEIGLKSEGTLSLSREFDEPGDVEVGDEVVVLLEQVESDQGLIQISKRKADRIRGWETIVTTKKEGDPVSGKVTRKIKGGLLVDIGVPVFLPASQVDIRRPADIGELIGRVIDAEILKIDQERRNIVISRRKLLERQRSEAKQKFFDDLKVGELRKGVVKNIADFGAFVDLGGVDGLLHIT